MAGGLAGDDDAVDEMVTHLRTTFELDAVSLLAPDPDGGWRVEAFAGDTAPASPVGAPQPDARPVGPSWSTRVRRSRWTTSACCGCSPPSSASALERRRLRGEAAEAAALAEADQLRTAILRAVSHDLRTPLASIKASATSLLQDDVDWSPEARTVFLATIDEEADRLNVLVGNLLDMSRLESGVLEVEARPVAFEEVVAQALASLSQLTAPIDIQVSEKLPAVLADAGLLERVVANVVVQRPALLARGSAPAHRGGRGRRPRAPAHHRPGPRGAPRRPRTDLRAVPAARATGPPRPAWGSAWPWPGGSPTPWTASCSWRTRPAAG